MLSRTTSIWQHDSQPNLRRTRRGSSERLNEHHAIA
jgi:hypothetical protein